MQKALILLALSLTLQAHNDFSERQEEKQLHQFKKETVDKRLISRGVKRTEWIEFELTAYCACKKCCGKSDGITASGYKVKEGTTIAVDTKVIPLGTTVYIEGIGYRMAQDTGSAIKGNRIDVYIGSHKKALEFGRVKRKIRIVRRDEIGS